MSKSPWRRISLRQRDERRLSPSYAPDVRLMPSSIGSLLVPFVYSPNELPGWVIGCEWALRQLKPLSVFDLGQLCHLTYGKICHPSDVSGCLLSYHVSRATMSMLWTQRQKGRRLMELELNAGPLSMIMQTVIALVMLMISVPTIGFLVWLAFVVSMHA